MDTDTMDAIEEEEEVLSRPSSWLGALAQLPGYPSEGAVVGLPQPMDGTARAVTSALDEDLDEEDLIGEEKELV